MTEHLFVQRLGVELSPPHTMRSILAQTAADYGVLPGELLGNARCAEVVRARQACMWRCRQVRAADGSHRYSLPKIGMFLGRDHTTVLHGVREHEKRLESARSD